MATAVNESMARPALRALRVRAASAVGRETEVGDDGEVKALTKLNM